MSDLDKTLAEEAEHAEQHKDAEPGPDTTVSRPNRTRSNVFSVRLNNDEMQRLIKVATEAGIAPSTMARTMIVKQLEGSAAAINRQSEEAARAAIQPAVDHVHRMLRDVVPVHDMIIESPLRDPKVREQMLAMAEQAARSMKR